MNSFDEKFLENLKLTNELVRLIRVIGESKGRQDLYKRQAPDVLENLRQSAIIQSTESSSRMEQVTAEPKRFKDLMAEKTKPQNRSEAEIAGYRDVLNTIHSSASGIPITEKVVQQFHRDLMKYTGKPGGKWKSSQNKIIETIQNGSKRIRFILVEPYLVNEFMVRLHLRLNEEIKNQNVDSLILIPMYILDFLCVHPFLDGNGRISRLLSLLLLYQQGYEVGHYISLERITEKTKDSYYETLEKASQKWHGGNHQPLSWITYFLSVVAAAYDEFEQNANVQISGRGSKTQMVLNAIDSFIGDFSIAMIEKSCPLVGKDMIRHVLKRLKQNGIIINIGKGRYARWRKV